ncbi:MAG: hypothetical protein ABR583_14455 [Gaiellaceae bacterium]
MPFALGLVGEEVSGQTHAAEVAAQGVPEERAAPLLFPDEQGRFCWYPATKW